MTTGSEVIEDRLPRYARAQTWTIAGFSLVVGFMIAFAGLQYWMPRHSSPMGLNAPAVTHFQEELLGLTFKPLDPPIFRSWYRELLGAAWGGYVLALWAGWRGGTIRKRRSLPLIVGLSLTIAVLCPASLSTDVYAYVSYGRMQACYGLNPYLTSPQALVAFDDPTVVFIGDLDLPSVYGPIWTLFSAGLVAAEVDLWRQVVGMKLVEAIALPAAAWIGGLLAERHGAERGDLAVQAIGLNPLLLIEGPGNGHNDVLMMTLLLGAALLADRGRLAAGGLAMGLAIGIKYLPIVAAPWLLLMPFRRGGTPRPAWAAGWILASLLAPNVIAFIPVWRGGATFSGVEQRRLWGVSPEPESEVYVWLLRSSLPSTALPWAKMLLEQWPLVDLHLVLTLCLSLMHRRGHWTDAWTILSAGLILWMFPVRFPWYITWPLMSALTRWDQVGSPIAVICLGFALAMSFWYS